MFVTALGALLTAPDDAGARPAGRRDLHLAAKNIPAAGHFVKCQMPLDHVDPNAHQQFQARRKAKDAAIRESRRTGRSLPMQHKSDRSAAQAVTDRILVILVEFAGTDRFTWRPDTALWDPLGVVDPCEEPADMDDLSSTAACENVLSGTSTFTYSGPLHNEIPPPRSADDVYGDTIWTDDFSVSYYENLIFEKGVTLKVSRQDGSTEVLDFTGASVADYFSDMSGGLHQITGQVVGWVQVPHSTWWYGTDLCPGALSFTDTPVSYLADQALPDRGSPRDLVTDALAAAKRQYPTLDWAYYDQDGDGVIDNLWIIHAGLGEESSALLNRTDYGEGAIWSHSSSLSGDYEIIPGIYAREYIMMPENSGISVLAHEYAHNLGAIDLYAYGPGETSAGFWTIMSNAWTGYPSGMLPPAFDPWHLENFGWLEPDVITDPAEIYNVTIGQASAFPDGDNARRAVRISLDDQTFPLTVQPENAWMWWGGSANLSNSAMQTRSPISIPAEGGVLSFRTAYALETGYDFLWVMISADGGRTWNTLTNDHTTCAVESGWIGAYYGFPNDLCAEGMGGFTGSNDAFPAFETETFSLDDYAGQAVLLRFWHMTDWAETLTGPFLDDIRVTSGDDVLFSDVAANGDLNWIYAGAWEQTAGVQTVSHSYYLQWRNVGKTGGYDRALGDPDFWYGPANTGLLVWYNNNFYSDNEIYNYLFDDPGFGPKGVLLAVDAHPAPYRYEGFDAQGVYGEAANISHRRLMGDAPFSLWDTKGFNVRDIDGATETFSESYWLPGGSGVPEFLDGDGYYPGLEYVLPWIGFEQGMTWMTRQWDASVVLPSSAFYGVEAEGYRAEETMGYHVVVLPTDCEGSDSYLEADLENDGLGYDGSAGNPADVGGQLGWHARVLDQTDEKGRVGVWNSRYSTPYRLKINKTGDGDGRVTDQNQIDCGGDCAALFEQSAVVTLIADADAGSTFAGWSGGGCSGEGDCTVTLAEDIEVTAEFDRNADGSGGGGGGGSCFIGAVYERR